MMKKWYCFSFLGCTVTILKDSDLIIFILFPNDHITKEEIETFIFIKSHALLNMPLQRHEKHEWSKSETEPQTIKDDYVTILWNKIIRAKTLLIMSHVEVQ